MAITAWLSFQEVVDLAGDALRRTFDKSDVSISWFDEASGLINHLYAYELGARVTIAPRAPLPGGAFEQLVASKQPKVVNSRAEMAGGRLQRSVRWFPSGNVAC